MKLAVVEVVRSLKNATYQYSEKKELNFKLIKMAHAIVIKTYPQLEKVFKKGDTVFIESVLETEDRYRDVEVRTKEVNKYHNTIFKTVKEKIVSKGNFINYLITNSQGDTYSESSIRNAIGYKSLSEIFKLN
ncbi:MAG: hypothetical protein ACJAVA_000289 [Flavobacteriaceae bacterium]|jgi:uncharacterized protein with gpF-like domain